MADPTLSVVYHGCQSCAPQRDCVRRSGNLLMRRVTSNVAYDYIRKRILSGEFAMGQPLSTNGLALAIGVSRTPVRDALRQLETDGLVESQPHFGASVRSIDINEFSELCMMRMVLESFLAGMAARCRTDDDLREIGLALENMRRIAGEISLLPDDNKAAVKFQDLFREDVRFHIAIMTAARKPRIKKEVLRLHLINRICTWERTAQVSLGVVDRAGMEEDRKTALISHNKIYQAVLKSEVEAARQAMAEHMQHIIDINIKRLSEIDMKRFKPRPLTEEEQIYSV
jgi:DNA-binding GntR family transcriptional regulator